MPELTSHARGCRRTARITRRITAAAAAAAAAVAVFGCVSPASADPGSDPLCSPGVVSRVTDSLMGQASSSGWASMTFDPVTGVAYVPYFDGGTNRIAAYRVAAHRFLTCGVQVGTNLGDTHDGANLHIDHYGYLHVINGRHGAPPTYLRSNLTHDSDLSGGFSAPPKVQAAGGKLPMPGATYPEMYDDRTNPDNLIVSARKKTARGHAQVQMSWSTNGGKVWSPGQVVIDLAATRPVYKVYSSLAQSDDGTLHLIWSPRLIVGRAPCDDFSNTGVFYAKSTDSGHTWTTAAGAPLTLPITEATEPAAVSVPAPVRIQAGMPSPVAFDSAGNPIVVYRQWTDAKCKKPDSQPATVMSVRWDGTAWTAPQAVVSVPGITTDIVSQRVQGGPITLFATQLLGSASPRLVSYSSADAGTTWTTTPRCLTAKPTRSVIALQGHYRADEDQAMVAYASGTSGYVMDAAAADAVACPPPSRIAPGPGSLEPEPAD